MRDLFVQIFEVGEIGAIRGVIWEHDPDGGFLSILDILEYQDEKIKNAVKYIMIYFTHSFKDDNLYYLVPENHSNAVKIGNQHGIPLNTVKQKNAFAIKLFFKD